MIFISYFMFMAEIDFVSPDAAHALTVTLLELGNQDSVCANLLILFSNCHSMEEYAEVLKKEDRK